MLKQVRAVVVDPTTPTRLSIASIELYAAAPNEVVVRVTTISLNRGEVKRALFAPPPGWRPGWDFVGVVQKAAADGSGPPVGARVVGLMPHSGSWAEEVHVAADWLHTLPDDVSNEVAATLPIAGLTALHALRRGGLLLGRKVLITGVTGGVGRFAVQLAVAAGARTFGHTRQTVEQEYALGSVETLIGDTLDAAQGAGPFDLIIESVGGVSLSSAMSLLAPNGVCVHLGISGSRETTFNSETFFFIGGASLYGFNLFHELKVEKASAGLETLIRCVRRKIIRPLISRQASWRAIGDVAQELVDRRFAGKAILTIDE